ncbi:hypothetical protein VTK26DRAFT_3690 [Humicola hyalothermophila]
MVPAQPAKGFAGIRVITEGLRRVHNGASAGSREFALCPPYITWEGNRHCFCRSIGHFGQDSAEESQISPHKHNLRELGGGSDVGCLDSVSVVADETSCKAGRSNLAFVSRAGFRKAVGQSWLWISPINTNHVSKPTPRMGSSEGQAASCPHHHHSLSINQSFLGRKFLLSPGQLLKDSTQKQGTLHEVVLLACSSSCLLIVAILTRFSPSPPHPAIKTGLCKS